MSNQGKLKQNPVVIKMNVSLHNRSCQPQLTSQRKAAEEAREIQPGFASAVPVKLTKIFYREIARSSHAI